MISPLFSSHSSISIFPVRGKCPFSSSQRSSRALYFSHGSSLESDGDGCGSGFRTVRIRVGGVALGVGVDGAVPGGEVPGCAPKGLRWGTRRDVCSVLEVGIFVDEPGAAL